MIFQIQLAKEDITAFCEVCTFLKGKKIFVELFQENKIVSGCSILGITTLLDCTFPIHFITRQHMDKEDMKLIERWKIN